ncbi:GFA family protein [Massilia sp. 9096]|uniref:GFA family protein n=1 Tax=Massilia sp. 9096 TaxID=1500894 RepID=UPI00056B7AC8|nr:GFA family protein [Massilia sp. 9096]
MAALRTCHGSCHCGAVRFAADLDLGQGTIQCNCSLCTKQRSWVAIVPASAFRLLAGAESLSTYRCNTRTEAHRFCSVCGVRVFHTGVSPRWGDYVAVSMACLDDVPAEEAAAAPVTLLDGRSGGWAPLPADPR